MTGTDPVPLYEKLKNLIRADIAAGRLTPGARIPAEREIAEKHGVSRITVKKALADLIVDGVLEHVSHQRGTFVRPPRGRAGSAQFIAVAIDDVRNSFGAQILRGIEDYLWGKRIHTLICNADRDFGKVEEYFRSLQGYDVAGVIFAPVIDHGYREGNLKLVGILEKAQIPYTLIDRFIPRLLSNYVGANHEESSHLLTRYLIGRGHRRILLARGMDCTSMDEREQGYRNACEEAGLSVDERLIVTANDNLLEGDPAKEQIEKMKESMAGAGEFTCLYALNDGLLRAGISALEALGRHPGDDVQLASHNEIERLNVALPRKIPHFVEPSYEMGWEAARILLEHINDPNKSIVQKVLKSRFVPPEE